MGEAPSRIDPKYTTARVSAFLASLPSNQDSIAQKDMASPFTFSHPALAPQEREEEEEYEEFDKEPSSGVR